MGARCRWGDDADFLLVGRRLPPARSRRRRCRSRARSGIAIEHPQHGLGARSAPKRYFAVTSNTVQFGAQLELFFGFDALQRRRAPRPSTRCSSSRRSTSSSRSPASLAVKVVGVGAVQRPSSARARGADAVARAAATARSRLLFFEIRRRLRRDLGRRRGHDAAADRRSAPIARRRARKADNWRALPPPRTQSARDAAQARRRAERADAASVGTLESARTRCRSISRSTRSATQARRPTSKLFTRRGSPARRGARSARDADEQFAPAQFQDERRREAVARRRSRRSRVAWRCRSAPPGSRRARRSQGDRIRVTMIDKDPTEPLPVGKFVLMIAGLLLVDPARAAQRRARSSRSGAGASSRRSVSRSRFPARASRWLTTLDDNLPSAAADSSDRERGARLDARARPHADPRLAADAGRHPDVRNELAA